MSSALRYHEIGHVKSIRGCIAIVEGMHSCVNGQLVTIGVSTQATIVGFNQEEAYALVLKENEHIKTGDEVRASLEPFNVPVGDKFIGRIVDALCEPQDSLGPIEAAAHNPIFPVAPKILDRQPLKLPLETGTKVLDTMIPIGLGQRQLILGNKATGKTTFITDVVLNQRDTDVICIYCAIGKARSQIARVVQLFQDHGAFDYSLIVSAPSSASAGQMYLAPYVACSLGEYWRDQGKHVFIGFDDFTKHAWAYREISLLLGRAPGRDSYPGDIFYLHSKMIERACYLSEEKGAGSMTFFPIVEILEGDLTAFVPSNLVSMTDGQIYLDSQLFGEGQRPALDLGLSVSRVGSKVQWPIIKKLGGPLRLEYLQYRELKRISQLTTTGQTDEQVERLRNGEILTKLLRQYKDSPVKLEALAMILYAYHRKYLQRLTLEEVDEFQDNIYDYAKKSSPEALELLRERKNLDDEIEGLLNTLLEGYVKSFEARRPDEGGDAYGDNVLDGIGRDVLTEAQKRKETVKK
ncbi:MAG: F0F1 ATP synthase subunit alpha [Candidatus Omnitrophica bacterium]|nr:F0F1 ATP synthase subunit alpha [Candidatus Omnitrophota bacterium]